MESYYHNLIIILHEPRYPENIGAAARCMKNMGLRHLRVVRPLNWDEEKILKMATHEAVDIVHDATMFDNLIDAVSDLHFLAGTTARTGRKRRPTDTPATIAKELVSMPAHIRSGILFGSEKWGLGNDAIGLCDSVVTIPTANFSSLNLAQSVMIICYEIMMASSKATPVYKPRIATIREKEGMFHHLMEVFEAIGLYQKQTPSYWLQNARRFFRRKDLTARDVKMIRGFLRQIMWAVKR